MIESNPNGLLFCVFINKILPSTSVKVFVWNLLIKAALKHYEMKVF